MKKIKEEGQRYHIAYGDHAAYILKEGMHEGLPRNRIICFREDFTQGPLQANFSTKFIAGRSSYWESLKDVLYNISDIKAINESSINEMQDIGPNSEIILWIGSSAYDLLASYWFAIHANKAKHRVFVVKIDELNIAMCEPKSLMERFKQLEELHPLMIKQYEQDWIKLVSESALDNYRILENGTIKTITGSELDTILLAYIPDKMTLALAVIEDMLTRCDLPLSDVLIEYRIRQMIAAGQIKYDGVLETMNDYSISL